MTLARDTSRAARDAQLAAIRRLDGPARVEMAMRMSDEAREISRAGIRHRHPDWSDERIRAALLEVVLGAPMANEVLRTRPARR
jgi:hypothetical protein